MKKMTKADLKAIIAKNPHVNSARFEKSLQVLRELQKTGIVHRQTYSIDSEESVCVSRN